MRSDEELLGVQIPGAGRDISETPFEVRGPRHAILEKLIEVYALEIRPGAIPESPGEAWVWNPDEGRLERLTRDQAAERDIELLPNWGFRSVPRWNWQSR